jgi:hypothetical protein
MMTYPDESSNDDDDDTSLVSAPKLRAPKQKRKAV